MARLVKKKRQNFPKRMLLGYIVRSCERCHASRQAAIYIDDNQKEFSDRRAAVVCNSCNGSVQSPLVVAVIAQRCLSMQPGEMDQGEETVLRRV